MREGKNPEKNRSKSVHIRTTPEDNCTSNNPGEEESLDNRSVNNEKSQRDANVTACPVSRPADERPSSFTIRTPLILEARVSKSNWFEPSKKTKIDLFQHFQNFLHSPNKGSGRPYFNEEDSQPGLTSSVVSRRKDIKVINGDSGEKQNNSNIKTVVTSQGSKRKIANVNNLSAPTSKRLLCSDKKKTDKRNQKKLHKPQTKSLLLNRSRSASKIIVKRENSAKTKHSLKTNCPIDDIPSTSKSYSTPKITIPNVHIYKDAICTCSNRQRSQSKRSSSTKSMRKSRKRKRSSESSTKRRRQSRTSAAKRRKSKKNYAKPRKSNKTSKSRTQSKQRRSTKNKLGSRNSRSEKTGVKSNRNEVRGERIATKRESKAKRLQERAKKIEPFKVKLKETLKEKKIIKKAALATKRRSVSRKDKRQPRNRKDTNAVRDAEVYSGKVSDTNHSPDGTKPVNKTESLREQGDSYNTPKERIVTTNADVEIQCCLLTSSQCLPNTRAQSMTNESINSNNFANESNPFGEHLMSTQESNIRNLDQEAFGETEQRVVNMNGKIEVSSQPHSLTFNPDLSLLNSGGTFSMMKEQTENPTSSFGQLGEHDGHLSEQNGKMSNLDGQATTRKKIESLMNVGDQIFACNQSHPLTLAPDQDMKSRNTDIMGEQIKIPSNSFNDSRELNECLSNPLEEISRNFDLKSFIQNETKENVLNIDDHIDRNNQSHSLTSAQDLQFDPGIDSKPMETRGNPNNCFGKSSEQFLNPPEMSNRNLDEQMKVRNMTKERLMTIDEPVEAQQLNFQPFTIQNLTTESGIANDMVEENENSSKLNGQWNGFTTRELRNEISSDEQSDTNNKSEYSLSSTNDQTETGSQSHSTESFQNLSSTPFSSAKEMTSEEKKSSVSSFNEPKRLTEQRSDLPDDRSIYLDEQISTKNEIEQCSTDVYNQAEDSQPHFKISAQNLTLADVVAKVMNEHIQPHSSSKTLNGHIKQLSKSTENIKRNSNQQVNNEFQKSTLSFKLHKTHNEFMALLPYEPSRFVSPLRENTTSGFLSNESDGFNEQFSNSPVETTNINEVGVSLLELVSLSLSQGVSPEDITYSSDQIQEVESKIRTPRCIYIQESDSIPEDEQESEISSAEDNSVPVNYVRPSTSVILQELPNWLRYLYNNLFRRKK